MRRLISMVILASGLTSTSGDALAHDAFNGGRPSDIPAFARLYKTSCSTCHAAAPKLNVLGEAFRLNGYRFPENDVLLRKEEPIPLGADPWKDLWPRAIWPGELPAVPPVSLRVVSDIQMTRDESVDYTWTYKFPNEIYGLAGGSLGDAIGFFVEAEWTPDVGVEVIQAKLLFQDPLPFVADRALNIWVGKQNLYLFTLGDRQIDRAARLRFSWSEFAPSDLLLIDPGSGDSLLSANEHELRFSQPAIEVNGIVRGRFYYALGLAQGTADLAVDNNARKDVYYKIRYKIGGLALDGSYETGGGPVLGTGGQLFDRGVILEHFGYLGAFPVENGVDDEYYRLGFAARWLYGSLDLGAGFSWGENDNPWGRAPAQPLEHVAAFLKGEYFIFPWLLASIKLDLLDATVPAGLREAGFARGSFDRTRLMPGFVMLIRQNVRGAVEAEVFTEHSSARERGVRRPNNLWLRLDVAF